MTESAAGDISRGIVRVFANQLGHGPANARTTISGNVVVVVLEDALRSAERPPEERDAAAMKRDMSAVVEGTLGCTVISALGDHDAERDIWVQVFVIDRAAA